MGSVLCIYSFISVFFSFSILKWPELIIIHIQLQFDVLKNRVYKCVFKLIYICHD